MCGFFYVVIEGLCDLCLYVHVPKVRMHVCACCMNIQHGACIFLKGMLDKSGINKSIVERLHTCKFTH